MNHENCLVFIDAIKICGVDFGGRNMKYNKNKKIKKIVIIKADASSFNSGDRHAGMSVPDEIISFSFYCIRDRP